MEQTTIKPEKKKKSSNAKGVLPIINKCADGRVLFRCYIDKALAKKIQDCVTGNSSIDFRETLINLIFKTEAIDEYIAKIKTMDGEVRAVLENYAKEHNICLK